MATRRTADDFERSAGGLDFDSPIHEHAASLGNTLAEGGPEALFDEIENLLPESWREQIANFPLASLIVGLGVGIFLGLKKGDELIAAGSSMIGAAAMSNITGVINRFTGD